MTRAQDAPGGEEEVAGAVYTESYAELTRFLKRLCGDAALAEDFAQEAGIRLVATMRRERVEHPRAFLFHAATNLARDHLRRQFVAQQHAAAQTESESAPAADQVAAARQEVALVARAIADLPTRARAVLQLARIEGYSQKEIAARLGIAPKTVENHLTRALAQLTAQLRSRGRQ
jgi:RNA polymerase sigma-70 factor (ECF subfamily)